MQRAVILKEDQIFIFVFPTSLGYDAFFKGRFVNMGSSLAYGEKCACIIIFDVLCTV